MSKVHKEYKTLYRVRVSNIFKKIDTFDSSAKQQIELLVRQSSILNDAAQVLKYLRNNLDANYQ